MAILPIDLQTLFAQLDKVARTQLAQREGLALQQAMQGVHLQRKASEQAKAVNEVQDSGDGGTEKVNDEGRKGHEGGSTGKRSSGGAAGARQGRAQAPVYSDPVLGKNVDISF